MRRTLLLLALGVLLIFTLGGQSQQPPLPVAADVIILNARVWTVDRDRPEAEAVAILRDRIVAVGSSDEVRRLAGPKTRVLDLRGLRVLPGFYDSHVHLLGGGSRLSQVALKDAKDEAEFGQRLKEFDARLPRDRWMLGGNWDHDRTLGGTLPSAELLDRYVPDRPVLIRRYDGHMAVANNTALKRAGITAETRDPPGGVIYRKPGTREPTGLLRDNAMSLVQAKVPALTDDEIAEAVTAALAEIRKNGITSVQDMDGSGAETRRKLFRLYQQLAHDGKLTCRIDLRWPLTAWKELAQLGVEANLGTDWIRIGGVKGFVDGSLGSSTAKMYEPYVNEPGSTGIYVTPLDALRQYVEDADAAGLSVAVHAIGDRANAELLDLFETVAKKNGPRDRRFRIEHAQHLRPRDYPRFEKLGVIPSLQPYHLIDDGRWAEGRIGSKRCASSYANRGLLDAGARLAFGSDWSVAPLSPILGIDAAVNRRTLDGKHPAGWFPEQKISVEAAVEAYTLGSAYAAGQERDRGSLAAGKLADLVVLDRDILESSERDRLAEAKVVLTLVGGKVVYENRAALTAWRPNMGPLFTKWARDVTPDNAHPEYPRPQLVRKEWLNLNGLWQLALAAEKEEPPLGKELAERILAPFPVESALSGVMKRAERLWYRRTFTLPRDWGNQRVLLHFGAVDWEARVWVNGKRVGEHRGGYDGFSFDITDHLTKDGKQEIVVGVWDPTSRGTQPRGKQVNNPRGIYYTPTTGIWQTVWLEPVAALHVESLKIVPDVDKGEVRVTVNVSDPNRVSARVTVLSEGKMVGSGTGGVSQPIAIPIREARLWTPETPHLYQLRVAVGHGDNLTQDPVESYFGMRKVGVGKDDKGVTRLLLNGKPYFQVGPLDQGFWPDGLYTAPTEEALLFDVEMTKKLGFNMTRKHVKVEPARWYYHCDRLGLLVWQDMPSGEKSIRPDEPDIQRSEASAKQYELELKEMIDQLHNHPSIVMWVVFNEGWGQFDTERITKWTKAYDPTRWVNNASGWADRKVGDVMDIHVYPGPGAPKPEEKRAGVLGEYGGFGLGIDGHSWSKQTWGYRGTRDRVELQRKYERAMQRVWELKESDGLSAAVYTQITDVETEGNGLFTYDRAVLKVDLERTAAVNRGDLSKIPQLAVVVPASQETGQKWRYTFKKPGDDWFKSDFDDSEWKESEAGFGTRETPGSVVRTEWKTSDIWIRRTFELPERGLEDPLLLIHHDEDATVYLNGVLAVRATGHTSGYEEVPINPEARKTLKPGKNHIAVHCKQTGGGQYIDVGIGDLKAAGR